MSDMTIEEAATEAAGNWKKFECFAWHRRYDIADVDNWAVIYTHNRDSHLTEMSNAEAIAKAMAPFTEDDNEDPDVVMESHDHWAVGHVDGFSIRVFKGGEITPAFRKYHELMERLAYSSVLDEMDHSNREYEATLDNIKDAAWLVKNRFKLPEEWEGQVYDWFSENDEGAIEDTDDQGGYPTEEQLIEAFEDLGYERDEE